MVIIDFAGGEYNAAANTLQQVSGELQGANIDDLSEAVESSMKGADSIATATRIEGRYISLLISHSRALEELARAAHAAGVNLAQTEANNTQQAKAQGQAALAGTAGATPSLAIYAEQASALNGSSRGPLRDGYLGPTLPTTKGGAQPEMPVYRPGQGMPPYAPTPAVQGPVPHPSPSPTPVAR